ncbi:hypothetical protein LIER_03682 [Lithospermum erythrorhizon]|uniref:Uncharacterized protein n=1 Tax=Lithospermum erythrorhizon TaxID=34254 RepID=A0AAV3NWS4_LITER
MNSNGKDNRRQGDDALNLNNLAVGRNEDAPVSTHIGSGRAPSKVGSSHPPEIEGLIHGLTGKIFHRIMEELKESSNNRGGSPGHIIIHPG